MVRDFSHGEVAVLGLGKSGEAACALLRWLGASVYASDASDAPAVHHAAQRLRPLGVSLDIAQHDLARIARATLVVVSPGIPPSAAPLVAAREARVEVISEVELALGAMPNLKYIAVTGTNGKTTVTELIAHLLRAVGYDAVAAGNVGTPLSEYALRSKPPAWAALELSSFQLHDTPSVAPVVGVLTNLAPDHLDRYASVDEYYADKALLFRNATRASRWVVNEDDVAARQMVAGVAGRIATFSASGRFAEAFLDRQHAELILEDEPVLPRKELPLLGEHNVANALAASLAIVLAEGSLSLQTRLGIAAGLRSFRAPHHRLEPVLEHQGVLWVNDSKATNVASTHVAIASMSRKTVLLLGGRHKGEPYTGLIPGVREHCRAVVAYGEAAPMIARDLADVVPIEVVQPADFSAVLKTAARLAQPGDVVLLSPACSSYDMFHNYEERGAAFVAFARSLGGQQ